MDMNVDTGPMEEFKQVQEEMRVNLVMWTMLLPTLKRLSGVVASIYQGVVPTSNENTSHFLLGFSYYYSGFAFYWDGAGEAFFRLGESTETQAVGNSWSNATGVPASGEIVLGLNIASTAATAQAHGEPGQGGLVAYKIPDNLDLD
ncbi:hypothetical protein FB45DRAFT_1126458 [Roridomyces roridus]|uniref:Uncharacterized protein n=1 Tax=Roridomyces roridus TaxID=1738132 RepID=A0AAD7C962_9AGAR|nr:hypothetical protein FB45DRAFT_1126458 [Roridomyces roridus]